MDTRGYEKNRRVLAYRIPDGYGYGYEANIYPTVKVRGSYYSYPTHPVDIPSLIANPLAMTKCTYKDGFHLRKVGPSPYLLGLSLLKINSTSFYLGLVFGP